MDARNAETRYFERRVSESLAMAAAASGPCAQIVHTTLARLYGDAIDALVAEPGRPTYHASSVDPHGPWTKTERFRPITANGENHL